MADYLDHSERWRTHQQPRRVDYSRPGFVRPADPCDCPDPAAIGDEPCDICGGGPDAA